MGQKVHPIGLRLGIIKSWESSWYAEKDYAVFLHEDIFIRDFIRKKMPNAGISNIEIERTANNIKITIYTGKPGVVIGKSGAGIDKLKEEIEKLINKQKPVTHKRWGEQEKLVYKPVQINVSEILNPELNAYLVAENIARQIEKRISYRRVMQQTASKVIKAGAKGIKICCSGRLGGAEIARSEWYKEGKIPLHTLRADIDYSFTEAFTTYGQIGVKVWIYKGDILKEKI